MEELLPLLTNDDEELVVFDQILNTKDRQYHYIDKLPGVFNLETLTDDFCFIHFRFYKADIRRLNSRAKVKGDEALCVLLKRLAYPCRLIQMNFCDHVFENLIQPSVDTQT